MKLLKNKQEFDEWKFTYCIEDIIDPNHFPCYVYSKLPEWTNKGDYIIDYLYINDIDKMYCLIHGYSGHKRIRHATHLSEKELELLLYYDGHNPHPRPTTPNECDIINKLIGNNLICPCGNTYLRTKKGYSFINRLMNRKKNRNEQKKQHKSKQIELIDRILFFADRLKDKL